MPDQISVLVVWAAGAGIEEAARLHVVPGTTIKQAVACSALVRQLPPSGEGVKYGVWGKLTAPQSMVRDGDRIEIYRPLKVDPKLARTRRAGKQKAANRMKAADG